MSQEPSPQSSEQTPLLAPSSPKSSTQNTTSGASTEQSSVTLVITIIFLYLLTREFGDELISPAQTRVFESIYCRQYYAKHDPSLVGSDGRDGVLEKWCKNSVVQGEVALLKGWGSTLDGLGMLLFSIPWGWFADKYGRKPTLWILASSFWIRAAYIQLICILWRVLPLKMVWLSSLYTAFGGGSAVTNAMYYTIISDVMPESERISIFFKANGVSVMTQFLAPLLSAWLMTSDPWIAMVLGLGIQFCPIVFCVFLPETLNYNTSPLKPSTSTSSSASSMCSMKQESTLRNSIHRIRSSMAFLSSDDRILLILPAFSLHLLLLNKDVLLQYISTRYAISLSQATVLISIRSGLIMLLLLLILPAVNHLIRTRWRYGPKRSDLLLSRASALAMALGFFLVALAPSIPLLVAAMVMNTFGWGLMLFLRNLLISLVEAHHVARLNILASCFDVVGLMFGSPLLAWLFEKGVLVGGRWTGLPFLFCAGAVAVVGCVLTGIGVGRDEFREDVRSEDEDV